MIRAIANNTTNGNMLEGPESPPDFEVVEGISESIFEILWRRRWTVLLVVMVALVVGLIYLQRAEPLYTSTSRIYVEQAGPQVWERDASGEVKRWTNYLYTQAELVRRTETLSAALKSPSMGKLQSLAGVSNPIAALRKRLDVVVGKNDEIINVSFTGPSPDEAAHIVNTVVDAYISSHNERRRDTAAEMVTLLEHEKTKWDDALSQKRQKMIEFRKANETLAFGTDQDNNSISRSLERYQSALDQARLARIEAKSFYDAAKTITNDPSGLRQLVEAQRAKGIYLATTSEATSLRAELNRLDRKRTDCLQLLKPDAPAIAALNAEMDQIRRQISELDKEFAASTLTVAQEQYLAAQQREKELETYLQEQYDKVIVLDSQLAQYALLQSDYEQTRGFCEILNEKIRRLNVDPQVGALNIEIVETAVPPSSPSYPNKARTMGLALCLGLFGGVGLGLLREWRDKRLRSTQDISALLGLPVLGIIPSMTSPKQTISVRGQKVLMSPDSREAEAFRTVRTAVFFGIPKDEAKTILITSPAPGEGKSTVVGNLAVAMAQADQRVLVMDVDFRRPVQHRIFELDRRTKGLSSVLAGQMSLQDAVEKTKLKNLDVLTVGPDVSNPAEMINSQSFAQIVKQMTQDYDRVIVDSPPVTVVADAQILAALCDVTVLVLRAEVSTRRISVQACENLASVDARILGVIVNDVSRKASKSGYYGGSDYDYYGHGDNGKHRRKEITESGHKDDGRSGNNKIAEYCHKDNDRAGMREITESDRKGNGEHSRREIREIKLPRWVNRMVKQSAGRK